MNKFSVSGHEDDNNDDIRREKKGEIRKLDLWLGLGITCYWELEYCMPE
jgi:hypothetical protein